MSLRAAVADAGRLRVGLRGRILIRGEAEQPCLLASVEGREARFRTGVPGVEGTTVPAVAYLDLVGRIEGRAVCVRGGDYVLTIEAPEPKLDRLRRQFAVLADLPAEGREELRGHRRIVPIVRDVVVGLPGGVTVTGFLRDLSRSGAAVEASAPVAVGDRVAVGSTRGRVARRFEAGFAVEFARLLPLEDFGPAFRP